MSWVAVGVGVASAAGSIYSGIKANQALSDAEKNMPLYKRDPGVDMRLAAAKARLEGRGAGSAAAERNIYQSQANTLSNIQRGATDPNQVLLGSGAAQDQTNAAFEKLQQLDTQDYERRLAEVAAAQKDVNAENQTEFGVKQQNYQMGVELEGAKQKNEASMIQTGIGAIGSIPMAMQKAKEKVAGALMPGMGKVATGLVSTEGVVPGFKPPITTSRQLQPNMTSRQLPTDAGDEDGSEDSSKNFLNMFSNSLYNFKKR